MVDAAGAIYVIGGFGFNDVLKSADGGSRAGLGDYCTRGCQGLPTWVLAGAAL